MDNGDHVNVTYDGRIVHAQILMISENQKSAMISFDAMLGGFVGMMPIMADDNGVYRDLIVGKIVQISRL